MKKLNKDHNAMENSVEAFAACTGCILTCTCNGCGGSGTAQSQSGIYNQGSLPRAVTLSHL